MTIMTIRRPAMKVANTVELKNKTNRLLHEVMRGNPVIITYRGKPAAAWRATHGAPTTRVAPL